MTHSVDRMLRRMSIALVGFLVVSLAIGVLYPVKLHMTGAEALAWVFNTLPIGAIIVYGILAASALIILGGTVLIAGAAKRWYYRLRGPDYRRYDDPEI